MKTYTEKFKILNIEYLKNNIYGGIRLAVTLENEEGLEMTAKTKSGATIGYRLGEGKQYLISYHFTSNKNMILDRIEEEIKDVKPLPHYLILTLRAYDMNDGKKIIFEKDVETTIYDFRSILDLAGAKSDIRRALELVYNNVEMSRDSKILLRADWSAYDKDDNNIEGYDKSEFINMVFTPDHVLKEVGNIY